MLKKNREFIDNTSLLITGCINASNLQRFLVLSDHKERFRQYIDSLRFYLEKSEFKRIVFCDNSGCSYDCSTQLYELANKLDKEFEWIAFSGDSESVIKRGKGYGEGEIIQYALENSYLLKKSTHFVKVTGRLKITNINSFTQKVKGSNNYFNVDIYRPKGIDTRLYCCDIDFYKMNLFDLYKSTYDSKLGKALEDIFYDKLTEYKNWRSLPIYPIFVGISAGNGRNYGKESKLKIYLFSLLCRINIFNEVYCLIYRGYEMTIKKFKVYIRKYKKI